MTLDHRLSRLERDLRTPPGDRTARGVIVVQEPHSALVEGELEAFLKTVSPERDVRVVMLADNGCDPGLFPGVTVSGNGWTDPPLPIENGRIIGKWRSGL
jgi:hypothetical protein